MKHEKPEVMEIGLKSMIDLNEEIGRFNQVSDMFYINYFT